MLNSWSNGFVVVNERSDFCVLLNPSYTPFTESMFAYYLVYKKYNTVEAVANSIIVINSFLEEAQTAYDSTFKTKQESKTEDLVH